MKTAAISSAVMLCAFAVMIPRAIVYGDQVVYVADPRAHVAGTDAVETYGLVHNFMNFDPAVEETIRVSSGESIFYLTGPQDDDGGPPKKGCEAVWYKNAPTSSIGFQYILFDRDAVQDTIIDVSSQTWKHAGPNRGKFNCKNNGQVKIKETYSGSPGQKFKRRVEVTTVVIQGPSTNPDTTASVLDNLNAVIVIQ